MRKLNFLIDFSLKNPIFALIKLFMLQKYTN